jgi:hypothetical protein
MPAAQARRFHGRGSKSSAAPPPADTSNDKMDIPSAVKPARTAPVERKAAQRVERLASGRRASGMFMIFLVVLKWSYRRAAL